MSKIILTRGLSSAGMIRRQMTLEKQYGVRVAGCRDDFSHGPLLPITDMDAFAESRARFWRNCSQITTRRQWLSAFAEIKTLVQNADCIEIWVDCTVQEQVYLLVCIQLLIRENIDLSTIKLVQFPNDDPYRIFGIFTEELLTNRPEALPLSQQEVALLRKAWTALTASSKNDLKAFVDNRTGSPILYDALSAFLLRYPNERNGLGSIVTKILQNANSEWTGAARIVGPSMFPKVKNEIAAPEWLDFIGDGILFEHLKQLAAPSLTSPCIEMRGDTKQMRSCEVRITKFGRDCLDGNEKFTKTNDLDEWIGGVHLISSPN